MKTYLAAVAVVAVGLAAASGVLAQDPPPAVEVNAGGLFLGSVAANGPAKLTVTSPAFKPMADIPFENTQYRGNVFPGLAWSAGPAGTKSYAVIMQDGDGGRGGVPVLHWTLFNIPASVTKLDAGMQPTANPAGSAYGPNVRGASQAYMGPRTPAGPKHRYHMQVFALDTTVDPAGTIDAITTSMKGHVLASGELVALGQVDPTAPPPAPRGGGAPPPAAPPAK